MKALLNASAALGRSTLQGLSRLGRMALFAWRLLAVLPVASLRVNELIRQVYSVGVLSVVTKRTKRQNESARAIARRAYAESHAWQRATALDGTRLVHGSREHSNSAGLGNYVSYRTRRLGPPRPGATICQSILRPRQPRCDRVSSRSWHTRRSA